ncbi:MAG: phage holin family protein [Acidimicrobiia bacterium]
MAPTDDTVTSATSGREERIAPVPQLVSELWELIVAYFKQETVVPLKQLGRYVALGLAGSLLLGMGVLFLAMAGLRALQTETGDVFDGNWSWAPYGIVLAVLLFGALITWKARGPERVRGST